MKEHVATNVDEYLLALPSEVRALLQKVRHIIKSAAPQAEELISYQIPGYKYLGALIFFAAFKNHCGLYAVSKTILKTLDKELQGFKTTGNTIHFTPDKPLPESLIKKIVKMRIKENEDRAATKKIAKKAPN